MEGEPPMNQESPNWSLYTLARDEWAGHTFPTPWSGVAAWSQSCGIDTNYLKPLPGCHPSSMIRPYRC
jgi:hypothetical protein